VAQKRDMEPGIPIKTKSNHVLADEDLVEIDTDNPEWRTRRERIMGAFTPPLPSLGKSTSLP